MADPLHIILLCSRLDLPGGIERAVVSTANLFASNSLAVTLFILDGTTQSFYPVAPGVKVEQENLHFGITDKGNKLAKKIAFLSHTRKLRERLAVMAPDVVLCSEYPFSIIARLALKGSSARIYAWEHHHFYHLERSLFWQVLFKNIYPRLDGVVCLNHREKKLFDAIGCRTCVIPNFVAKREQAMLEAKNILTIGWLTTMKGIELVPAIAELVFAKYPDWHWTIIGRGEEEETLRTAIRNSPCSSQVSILPPTTPDLAAVYRETSCYVMLSKTECFPMVLLEAMSFGIPCVAFDCPTGPSAIIRHNEDGYLVHQNNIEAMAGCLSKLIADQPLRKRLGDKAYQNIERFSPAAIYDLWQKLFAE